MNRSILIIGALLWGAGCATTGSAPSASKKTAELSNPITESSNVLTRGPVAKADPGKESEAMAKSQQKNEVRALLKSLETGAQEPVKVINPKQYTQHNPDVGDGLAGFGEFLQQIPAGSIKVNTQRIFADGDYVFAHSEYNLMGPKVGFDIFRFENGKIVEHWDNLAAKEDANPSGHTQTDGPTIPSELEKTNENKALVKAFVHTILIDGQMDELGRFFSGDEYIQHNPQIADGITGLGAALEAMAKQGITMEYNKNHLILGEGNFVLAVSEGTFGGKHVSFYDLFRVANGKIAEHWDVISEIPPIDAHKNKNGKF